MYITNFSDRYKRYALVSLTAVYTLSFMDRLMIGILMQPMKEDLHLSDTQLGFLTGIAFAVFYATLGLPIARWADQGNRVTIVSLAIGLWSLMVAACGIAGNFYQLILVRIGAAVGEAGVFPPAYSLIGDYFDEKSRVRAFSIFMTGLSASLFLSYIIAGWLNELVGWRMTFVVVSIPGALAAVLVRMTLKEPRSVPAKKRMETPKLPELGLKKAIWVLLSNRTYRYIVAALTFANFAGIGVGYWQAVYFIRQYAISTTELGLWMGILTGGFGAIATWLGGVVASRVYLNDHARQLRMSALIVALMFPGYLLMLYLPWKVMALFMIAPVAISTLSFYGPVVAMIQDLVDDRMRAVAMALLVLVLNLIAMGLGPQLVGVLSDLLTPSLGVGGLRLAMAFGATAALASAWCFWRASYSVALDVRARQELKNDNPRVKDTTANVSV
jgi:predicted MFS family arabinose efflux permease